MMIAVFALGLLLGSYVPRLNGWLTSRLHTTQMHMRNARPVSLDVLIDQAIGKHPVATLPRQRGRHAVPRGRA